MSNMKEMIEFPVIYTFKAMGLHTEQFVEDVKRVFIGRKLDGFEVKPSSKGNYVSVSATTEIKTFDELQATYTAIKKIDGLKYHL